ncbi:unnamed protein product, partial [Prorocentrum cordatum]
MDLASASACAEWSLAHARQRPLALARLLERVARTPACVEDLRTKSDAETRCVQRWYKIAIGTLLGAGEEQAATAMWERAVAVRAEGSSTGILWPSVQQTPTMWISGLRSRPLWECGQWPLVEVLQSRASEILGELAQHQFGAAYPYLSQNGSWENLFLYRGGRWNEEICSAMRLTCRLLIPELPTRPEVPFHSSNNEEVVVFRSRKGAHVGPHCGASNNQINVHLTLAGAGSALLRVGSEQLVLRDGKAICFQDSYSHSVEHEGDMERISLVVRVMHPDISTAAYGGRTDMGDVSDREVAQALGAELQRLRAEYRRLAAEWAPSPPAAPRPRARPRRGPRRQKELLLRSRVGEVAVLSVMPCGVWMSTLRRVRKCTILSQLVSVPYMRVLKISGAKMNCFLATPFGASDVSPAYGVRHVRTEGLVRGPAPLRPGAMWVGCAIGLALRYLLYVAGAGEYLEEHLEVNSPITSHSRLKEGFFLLESGSSPYAGDTCHHPPLLLLLLSPLRDAPALVHLALVAAVDVATALLLRQMAVQYAAARAKAGRPWAEASRKPTPQGESGSVSYAVTAVSGTLEDVVSPAFVGLSYLMSPFTVASSIALSLQNVQHLATCAALCMAGAGRGGFCAGAVALALYVCPWTPVVLIPCCAYLCYAQKNPQAAEDHGYSRSNEGVIIEPGFVWYLFRFVVA